MSKLRSFQRILIAVLLVTVGMVAASPVRADNITIANATTCSGTPPGGTICSNGSGSFQGSGGTPLSLTGIENGTIVLLAVIGTQTSPVYEVVNNTGSTVTSFSFVFTGSLPSNQFLDCQVNGGFSGASCTISGAGGTVGTNAQYGPNALLPATITFSGLNIANGATFDIAFSSFANGASGQVTGVSVPEPGTVGLLGAGGLVLGFLGIIRRHCNLRNA